MSKLQTTKGETDQAKKSHNNHEDYKCDTCIYFRYGACDPYDEDNSDKICVDAMPSLWDPLWS